MTPREKYTGKKIVHMGDVWEVIGVGDQTEGNTYCHLKSTSRGRKQKNGWMPFQICDYVDTAVLDAAK